MELNSSPEPTLLIVDDMSETETGLTITGDHLQTLVNQNTQILDSLKVAQQERHQLNELVQKLTTQLSQLQQQVNELREELSAVRTNQNKVHKRNNGVIDPFESEESEDDGVIDLNASSPILNSPLKGKRDVMIESSHVTKGVIIKQESNSPHVRPQHQPQISSAEKNQTSCSRSEKQNSDYDIWGWGLPETDSSRKSPTQKLRDYHYEEKNKQDALKHSKVTKSETEAMKLVPYAFFFEKETKMKSTSQKSRESHHSDEKNNPKTMEYEETRISISDASRVRVTSNQNTREVSLKKKVSNSHRESRRDTSPYSRSPYESKKIIVHQISSNLSERDFERAFGIFLNTH